MSVFHLKDHSHLFPIMENRPLTPSLTLQTIPMENCNKKNHISFLKCFNNNNNNNNKSNGTSLFDQNVAKNSSSKISLLIPAISTCTNIILIDKKNKKNDRNTVSPVTLMQKRVNVSMINNKGPMELLDDCNNSDNDNKNENDYNIENLKIDDNNKTQYIIYSNCNLLNNIESIDEVDEENNNENTVECDNMTGNLPKNDQNEENKIEIGNLKQKFSNLRLIIPSENNVILKTYKRFEDPVKYQHVNIMNSPVCLDDQSKHHNFNCDNNSDDKNNNKNNEKKNDNIDVTNFNNGLSTNDEMNYFCTYNHKAAKLFTINKKSSISIQNTAQYPNSLT